ncbi:hypothetical protein ACA135_03860 [Methanobrevibacter acididurans]|jgi:hypothetical protein|uniref:hypothetical protein n=1 Tax=Methanobrevibacter acididurans TaxID=120963 RepID=UPI0038FBF2D1
MLPKELKKELPVHHTGIGVENGQTYKLIRFKTPITLFINGEIFLKNIKSIYYFENECYYSFRTQVETCTIQEDNIKTITSI